MSSFLTADLANVEGHSARSNNPVAASPGLARLGDEALLERFLTSRDAEAFETLVMRHGPAVLRICQRSLGWSQQADDAFQATFLVLVNRAGAIRHRESIDPWLRGVAEKVAGRLKMQIDQRRKREGAAVDVHEVAAAQVPLFDDLSDVVRTEVERLPEAYRNPIVLCYWEGLTSEQAAKRLSCPTGTIKWRLARARDLLRKRLSKLSLGVMVLLLGRHSPATAAADMLANTSDMGISSQPVSSGGPSLVPQSLLSRTVAVTSHLRDNPLNASAPDLLKPAKRGLAGFGIAFSAMTWLVVVAILTVAIPSIPALRRLASASFPPLISRPAHTCH